MRAAFPYLGRGSWLARRDPRVLILVAAVFVIAVIQLRDARHLAVTLALALGYYAAAGIPWKAVRVQWAYLLFVIFLFSLFNTLISGGRTGGFAESETHVLLRIPPFGAEISAEGLSLMLSQMLRFACIAAVSFPVAFCIAPGDFGVALRRLGLGDRIAVMIDLTIRFIPTLANEFSETIDAQRVRGYDPAAKGGNPVTRLRRAAPIFVPVTVGSIAGAEDTIDAMDLRGFGVGPRTWSRRLRFDRLDWAVVVGVVAFAVTAFTLGLTGNSQHYLLPFLV
ncbi:MAG TPA: energy-coupling factor transporter transmembrane component T [Candidatus Limnocylindria bacterium]|jgi:energy-coupling factor transport system permease protein